MSTSPKNNGRSSNGPTHLKRLARAFAQASGRPYAQCLEIARRAHAAGRLPTPLDDEGIAASVELLMQIEPPALDLPDTATTATPTHAPVVAIPDPWSVRPSFGTLLDGSRAELGDHLLIVANTGAGKTVTLNHLAVGALRLGWNVEYIDALKLGSSFNAASATGVTGHLHISHSMDEATQWLGLYQDELIETHALLARHDVDHISHLPEDARGVPTLIVIDEWVSIAADERLARIVSRLVATGRSAGIHVAISTQDAWANGWDPAIKDNMDRLMLGRAALGAVAVTFRNPDAAAALYNGASETFGTARGIGIYERHGIPQVVRIKPPTQVASEPIPVHTSNIAALMRGAETVAQQLLTELGGLADEHAEELREIVRRVALQLNEPSEADGTVGLDRKTQQSLLRLRSRESFMAYLGVPGGDASGLRASVIRGRELNAMHPVDAALILAKTAPERHLAGNAANQRIWDASWAFEKLTGYQGLIVIESPGRGKDRYRFGDDGTNGSFTALGADEAERHIMGRLDSLRSRTDLPGPEHWRWPRCMICKTPVDPESGVDVEAEETLDGHRHGTQRITLCAEHATKYHGPVEPTATECSTPDGLTAAQKSRFFGRHDSGVLHEYLASCPVGTAETFKQVGEMLSRAETIETWWYPDEHSPVARRIVRRPTGYDSRLDLALQDADGITSYENFDWSGEPEKAQRHRIHADGLGVTIYTPAGTLDRTHRVLGHPGPVELTSLPVVAPLPKPNTLWWARDDDGTDREMVKVNEIHRDENGHPTRISAEVVLPIPPRTTVRFWTIEEATRWAEISDADLAAYEKAWGFSAE